MADEEQEGPTWDGEFLLPATWEPLEQFFAPHPKYHMIAALCLKELFYGTGPLKRSDRHYIALMTAAHHDCHFLTNLHKHEFEQEGGDPSWLLGLRLVAEKRYAVMDELVHLISHQPWRVGAELVSRVLRDDDIVLWSIGQVVHAAVIISTTTALCALVHGLGTLDPIIDTTAKELSNMATRCELLAEHKKADPKAGPAKAVEIDFLLERMEFLRNAAKEKEARGQGSAENKRETFFFALAEGRDENNSGISNAHIFTLQKPLSYVDFACRQDASKTFKIHEFDWDHGYSLIADCYEVIANQLDRKFALMQHLTYKTMGDYENVDTWEYRLAIWNYIHALFGIRHDDYDYAQVNELLSRAMKTFVKTATCYPSRMTSELRAQVMPDFTSSEKIHVLLLVVEARTQANLLYFARALTNYYVLDRDRRRPPM